VPGIIGDGEPVDDVARTKLGLAIRLLSVGLLLLLVVRCAWVGDDAYISFRTVHNFVEGHGLRWNVAERVQVFTHPLWLFLVSGLYALGADVFGASLGLSFLLTAAVGSLLAFGGPGRGLWGPAAVVALACSKSFVDYSTSGLENPLLHLLLLLFLRELLTLPSRAEGEPGRGDASLLRMTLLGSLLALTRPDAVLLVAPGIALAALRVGVRRALPRLVLGLTPLLAWEAFSLIYFGDFIPNTARAKLQFETTPGVRTEMGLRYLLVSCRIDPVLGPVILAGLGFAAWTRDARALAAAAGAACTIAYLLSIGGDFMLGRFLAAPLLVSVTIVAFTARSTASPRWPAAATAVLVGVSLVSPSSPFRVDSTYNVGSFDDPLGLADERGYYFPQWGLFGRDRYRKSMPPESWDGSPPQVVLAGGGGEPFCSGPGLHYVDIFALTDPLLARLPMTLEGPYRPGHVRHPVPDGYLESLESGRNLLVDPEAAALWDDVRLATRAPLGTRERGRAIARLALRKPPRDDS